MSRTIVVIGTGYVGLPAVLMWARAGQKVVGVDINENVVRAINERAMLLNEHELHALLNDPLVQPKLVAQTTPSEGDVFVIAVPTPVDELKKVCDLEPVQAAIESIRDEAGIPIREWKQFENDLLRESELSGNELEKAIWNLSIILGRTYHETRETYNYFEEAEDKSKSNNGLFRIIYSLGNLIENEIKNNEHLVVHFRPSLIDMIMHQISGKKWSAAVTDKLCGLGLEDRPVHIISANLHSVVNLLYGYHAIMAEEKKECSPDVCNFILDVRDKSERVRSFAGKHGFCEIEDRSGAQTNVQIIDTSGLEEINFHPGIKIDSQLLTNQKPVLIIMYYAFGLQAFDL